MKTNLIKYTKNYFLMGLAISALFLSGIDKASADENLGNTVSATSSIKKIDQSESSTVKTVFNDQIDNKIIQDASDDDNYKNKDKFGNKEYVKFNLGHLIPINDFEGEFKVTLGESSKLIEIKARKSERINGFIQLPISTGNYVVELKDNIENKLIFKISGVLSQDNEKYSHQLLDVDHDVVLLSPVKGKSGFSIDLGYAEGSLKAEVKLVNTFKEECDVNLSLDSNADGVFQPDEKVKRIISIDKESVKGASLTRLPLTSKYEVNVLCDSLVVASNRGSYDFANGEAVNSEKSRDADFVRSFAIGVERIPYITVVSIPGETIFPIKENLEILPDKPQESWDYFGSRDEDVEAIDNDNKDIINNNFGFNKIFDWFTNHPWSYVPASLILGVLIIGFFIAIAIISQRKNQL